MLKVLTLTLFFKANVNVSITLMVKVVKRVCPYITIDRGSRRSTIGQTSAKNVIAMDMRLVVILTMSFINLVMVRRVVYATIACIIRSEPIVNCAHDIFIETQACRLIAPKHANVT